jgi:muconolactone delta-isomerase
MSQFMIVVRLPEYLDNEFVKLIPKQRSHIDKLMADNIIFSYSLSLDRTQLWIIVAAEEEREIIEMMQNFPLYDWMKYDIQPLMFHSQSLPIIPISLN